MRNKRLMKMPEPPAQGRAPKHEKRMMQTKRPTTKHEKRMQTKRPTTKHQKRRSTKRPTEH